MHGRQSEVILDTHPRRDGSRTFDNCGQCAFLSIPGLLLIRLISQHVVFIHPRYYSSFPFGHSSTIRAVFEAVTIPSPPPLHGLLCACDIPTGHAVLASTILGLCSPGFRDLSMRHASINSSVSTLPALPHLSRQLPDAYRLLPRMGRARK